VTEPNPRALEVPSSDDADESEQLARDELAELASAAQEGDSSAFEELVRRTHKSTYTLALRLTANEEDARDVTQEVYLRAFKGLKNYRGDAQITTWLYRITANCASTFLTTRGRHRHQDITELAEPADPSNEADVELMADAADLRRGVDAALAQLPPRLRAVVVLRDVYDMPHEAIANELGISVSAAKVRLHRARHKLRAELFPEIDQVDVRAV
jgi:RNA polymerase sigma-70 factor (ECF subfamily)